MPELPHPEPARAWFEETMNGTGKVGFPWPTLLDGEARPDVANDAHLGALAIEHGLTVCSTDRDFSRFVEVRWENPLAG